MGNTTTSTCHVATKNWARTSFHFGYNRFIYRIKKQYYFIHPIRLFIVYFYYYSLSSFRLGCGYPPTSLQFNCHADEKWRKTTCKCFLSTWNAIEKCICITMARNWIKLNKSEIGRIFRNQISSHEWGKRFSFRHFKSSLFSNCFDCIRKTHSQSRNIIFYRWTNSRLWTRMIKFMSGIMCRLILREIDFSSQYYYYYYTCRMTRKWISR